MDETADNIYGRSTENEVLSHVNKIGYSFVYTNTVASIPIGPAGRMGSFTLPSDGIWQVSTTCKFYVETGNADLTCNFINFSETATDMYGQTVLPPIAPGGAWANYSGYSTVSAGNTVAVSSLCYVYTIPKGAADQTVYLNAYTSYSPGYPTTNMQGTFTVLVTLIGYPE